MHGIRTLNLAGYGASITFLKQRGDWPAAAGRLILWNGPVSASDCLQTPYRGMAGLAVTVTNTDEAEAAHRTEASLRTEHERYARAILALNQEFALRQTSFAPSIRGE